MRRRVRSLICALSEVKRRVCFGIGIKLLCFGCSIAPQDGTGSDKFFGDTLSAHPVDRIVAVASGRLGAADATGFLIDPTNVLTNRHVSDVGAINIVRVPPSDAGTGQGVEVAMVDDVIPCELSDCDLAILRLSRPLHANWDFSLSSSRANQMPNVHIASHHNYHSSTKRPDGNPPYSPAQTGFLSAALTAQTINRVGDTVLGFSEWGVSDFNESGRQPFDQVFTHKGDSGSAVISLAPPRMVGVVFTMSASVIAMVDVRRPEIQAWLQEHTTVEVESGSGSVYREPVTVGDPSSPPVETRHEPPAQRDPAPGTNSTGCRQHPRGSTDPTNPFSYQLVGDLDGCCEVQRASFAARGNNSPSFTLCTDLGVGNSGNGGAAPAAFTCSVSGGRASAATPQRCGIGETCAFVAPGVEAWGCVRF